MGCTSLSPTGPTTWYSVALDCPRFHVDASRDTLTWTTLDWIVGLFLLVTSSLGIVFCCGAVTRNDNIDLGWLEPDIFYIVKMIHFLNRAIAVSSNSLPTLIARSFWQDYY